MDPENPEPGGVRRIGIEMRNELLALARLALEMFLGEGREFPAPAADRITGENEGVFVTLRHRGDLRGCIGLLRAPEPLPELVQHCAVAASRDPRFPPLKLQELPGTSIEISVLGPARAILGPEEFRAGEEGLIVTLGRRKGLLLPQVAKERDWDAVRFLEETCVKAGLPRNAWRSGAKVEAFPAEVFREEDPGRAGPAPT